MTITVHESIKSSPTASPGSGGFRWSGLFAALAVTFLVILAASSGGADSRINTRPSASTEQWIGKPAAAREKPKLVWLRGTNGRLLPTSPCVPIPSWGFWRARCPTQPPPCDAPATRRYVDITFATNVTVASILCSGACPSRYPSWERVAATEGTVYRLELGKCPTTDSATAVPTVVDGAPANDVYLDVQVVDDTEARGAETCFLSIGDWGKAGPQLRAVSRTLHAIAQRNAAVRFIVSTGDNFYPAGLKSIDDPQVQETFVQPFAEPLLQQLVWFGSAGNHDQWGMKGQLDLSSTSTHPKRSERWYFPSPTYSVEIPVSPVRSMRLVTLDTFGKGVSAMLDFLASEMGAALNGTRRVPSSIEAARARAREQGDSSAVPVPERWQGGAEEWRVVVNHAPLYSGSHHGQDMRETGASRRLIKPFIDRARAHMYLSGHDHVLEVHRDDGLTDYFVSGGGGGSSVYSSKRLPTTQYHDPSGLLGFMQHCFKNDVATTTVYGAKDIKPLYVHRTPLLQQPRAPH